MILKEGDLEFNFQDSINAIKFDGSSHGLSHCMKAVDFIVEYKDYYAFIEIKDPSNPKSHKKIRITLLKNLTLQN